MARIEPGKRRSLPARIAATTVCALGFCVAASALGLSFNALRPASLPLVAPFPYRQDCPEKIDLSAPTVSVARALALRAEVGAVLVDARPEEDHRRFHLPGAVSLPLSIASPLGPDDVRQLKKHRLLIVYCDSPDDRIARLQAEQLRAAGIERTSVLEGGVEAYRRRAGGKGR